MKTVIEMLQSHPQVSDFKINIHQKESYELFFVKGKLETVRCTDTCDKEVTVYADHDSYKGDAQFFIYPSSTPEEIKGKIDEAAKKAMLIHNQAYDLPGKEEKDYEVASNFSAYSFDDLAARISNAVFSANTLPNGSLNSVEVFVNKHTETVLNSRGLRKSQIRYDAMVEAIPTYNGAEQSVELYEQYNFGNMDVQDIIREISGKMDEVKARFEAVTPEQPLACNVILNSQELSQLFMQIAYDLNCATVYSHSNLFKKGDAIQKDPQGDLINISMAGEVTGSVRSSKFDSDGVTLGSICIVENGKAVNYYGSNRHSQYLNEKTTGNLRCMVVGAGSADPAAFEQGPYLEIVSMSGLQVDLNNDYIGGEIRLAYYHDGVKRIPVTGISISGSLEQVLNNIRLSSETAVFNGYFGPVKAILSGVKIF